MKLEKMTKEELIDEVISLRSNLEKKKTLIKRMKRSMKEQSAKTIVRQMYGGDYADVVFTATERILGISRDKFLCGLRSAQFVRCKTIAGYILRETSSMTLYECSDALRVDHSSVCYYSRVVRQAYDMYDKDKVSRNLIDEVEMVKKEVAKILQDRGNPETINKVGIKIS